MGWWCCCKNDCECQAESLGLAVSYTPAAPGECPCEAETLSLAVEFTPSDAVEYAGTSGAFMLTKVEGECVWETAPIPYEGEDEGELSWFWRLEVFGAWVGNLSLWRVDGGTATPVLSYLTAYWTCPDDPSFTLPDPDTGDPAGTATVDMDDCCIEPPDLAGTFGLGRDEACGDGCDYVSAAIPFADMPAGVTGYAWKIVVAAPFVTLSLLRKGEGCEDEEIWSQSREWSCEDEEVSLEFDLADLLDDGDTGTALVFITPCCDPLVCNICPDTQWTFTVTGTVVDPDNEGLKGTFFLESGPQSHYAACASDPCSFVSTPITTPRAIEGTLLWKVLMGVTNITIVLVAPKTDFPCNEALYYYTADLRDACNPKTFNLISVIDPGDVLEGVLEPVT